MNDATPARAKVVLAWLLSVVTLASLMVAPCCSSFCAGRSCSQNPSEAGKEAHCHATGAASDNAAHLRARRNCSASYLQVINLTPVKRLELLQNKRTAVSDDGTGTVPVTYFSMLQTYGVARGAPSDSPPFSSPLPETFACVHAGKSQ
jgi:hypothetical protein